MIYDNGIYREETAEEIVQREADAQRMESEYWLNTPYDDLVNAEIRKKYSESQEFAVLRQRDEKPDEYSSYFRYCEDCKTLVKSNINLYRRNA